jgi:hypothetical protein
MGMNLPNTHRKETKSNGEDAEGEDFCELCVEDLSSLYLLSFLLTRDHGKAEQCLVAAVEDSAKERCAFEEWAPSWTRRAIIRNAIQLVSPHSGGASVTLRRIGNQAQAMPELGDLFARVLALEDFERLVFVILVLERYSDQDCSALLGYSRQEIEDERIRALHHISGRHVPDLTQPANSENAI